ncbi:MAG TPA: multicopper oxidase domain-containing protein, partial [Anaerolineales bacterium]|nr:multicopper oxidase domain-containing protein [Anaerolineales bacterium]
MSNPTINKNTFSRRDFLKVGLIGTGAVALSGARLANKISNAKAGGPYTEVYPTSPLILDPFRDELPIPMALAPTPKSEVNTWKTPPGSAYGQQNSYGSDAHQIWPSKIGYPEPLVYKINLQVNTHSFTTSQVLPIDSNGNTAVSFDSDGNVYPEGTIRNLPASTIYGFNGTFPGPRINAEYGKPALIRFVNNLDENPDNLDRQDFGAPDWSFLTHLHNAHTAPESDGNPNYTMKKSIGHGYEPGTWCDNLYLNWPAGGDDNEKQTFFWFHDHRMDHTGSNVYKGMVGLY